MSIDARGAAEGEIQASLKKAWDQGYDAVTIKNYTSPDGRKGTVLVVKDLAQLRSPLARFDPKNRNSADLLAGLAGAGILAPMFLSGGQSQSASPAATGATPQANEDAFWDAWRRGDAL